MNVAIFNGNLTKDPEVRMTTSGKKVCNFSVAVNSRKSKDRDEEPVYCDCVCWEKAAEILEAYARKGTPLLVFSTMQMDRWEKDGVKHSRMRFNVDRFEFLGGGKKKEEEREPEREPESEPVVVGDETAVPF